MAQGESYKQFVEKFKPKKTTDDCYTPEVIMEAVNKWVEEKYGVNRSNFVRPFYPGGDYENFNYPEGAVVVDNPPFSILARIIEFYAWKNIKYFLFAPSLTCISGKALIRTGCAIPVGANVTYANGACVNTGFVTNLETDFVIKSEPELYKRIGAAEAENVKGLKKSMPKYDYPMHVVTAAMVQRYAKYGVDFCVRRRDSVQCKELDAQRQYGKAVFGGGLLVSTRAAAERAAAERAAAERAAAERAAAERAAAERAAAERAAATTWELSERERHLIALIDERSKP